MIIITSKLALNPLSPPSKFGSYPPPPLTTTDFHHHLPSPSSSLSLTNPIPSSKIDP
ncbi:hypothetical protein HanIR_Chr09g0426981 [Helianthus annuus]|nr:hypothetical protein HanIR_Chr09g0426981 [Helianthus annuus]